MKWDQGTISVLFFPSHRPTTILPHHISYLAHNSFSLSPPLSLSISLLPYLLHHISSRLHPPYTAHILLPTSFSPLSSFPCSPQTVSQGGPMLHLALLNQYRGYNGRSSHIYYNFITHMNHVFCWGWGEKNMMFLRVMVYIRAWQVLRPPYVQGLPSSCSSSMSSSSPSSFVSFHLFFFFFFFFF